MYSITKTLRLKVQRESYPWLDKAAREVNTGWNWCNEVSADAADRTKRGFGGVDGMGRPMAGAKFLTGFDLCRLASGGTEVFDFIGADTIQRICTEYTLKRQTAGKMRLKWRKSGGPKRSLGWVPFVRRESLRR